MSVGTIPAMSPYGRPHSDGVKGLSPVRRGCTQLSIVVGLLVLTLGVPLQGRSMRGFDVQSVSQETTLGQRALMNINNISMWFERNGSSGLNPLIDDSGVTFPRSTAQVVFQDGLIWGGRVLDGDAQILRVGGQTFLIGTVPGAILSQGVGEDPGDPSVRIYRVRRDFRTADLRTEAAELFNLDLSEVGADEVALIRDQYEKDWLEWPWQKGAPFVDRDGNGVYDAAFGAAGAPDSDSDEPGLAAADQVAWYVINDLDIGATTALYGSRPIGLEVQVTLWGYGRTDALGDVIFKKHRLIYKGTGTTPDSARIEDMYVAQWSDPDLGDGGDDLAGSDVDLSLGYVYNASNDDFRYSDFQLPPPAVGYDFLQGPIVPVFQRDENGDPLVDEEGVPIADESSTAIFDFGIRTGFRNLPMTSFVFFAAGSAISDPIEGAYDGTREWYNLLRGFQPQPDTDNPVAYTDPTTGEPTPFTVSGDPLSGTGWIDGDPLPAGDRRIVLNTGPFEMALGDTQEVVVALLGGLGPDRLRSISRLKFSDQFVQDAYNSFFAVPAPPAGPRARAAELDRKIVLDWGWNLDAVSDTEESVKGGFEFEGYNVYQLPAVGSLLAAGRKLATFDVANGRTAILGVDLDPVTGLVVKTPRQNGSDSGIERSMVVNTDAVRNRPLVNGQEYYFAVTAYNINSDPEAITTSLESTAEVVVAVPQPSAPGTQQLSDTGLLIKAEQIAGRGDGSVEAFVIDPTRTRGDPYAVSFDLSENGRLQWELTNEATSTLLLDGQTDQQGSRHYVGSEGFEVRVQGPAPGMKEWSVPSGERWYSWVGADWGAEGFGGAITGDPNTFWLAPSSVSADRARTVELRFADVVVEEGRDQYRPVDLVAADVSWAYRYLDHADAPVPAPDDLLNTTNPYDWSDYVVQTEGPGFFVYQDRVPIGVAAYDVQSDPPRRLEVGFIENNVPEGLVNGAYGPAWQETTDNISIYSPSEWLIVFDLGYTDPNAAAGNGLLTDHGLLPEEVDLPIMWIVFASRLQEDRFPREEDSFLLVPTSPLTAEDVFSFEVPGITSSDSLGRADARKIKAFPNPYYGVNEAETSRHDRFITFSHLPEHVRIQIFDLAGTRVRTLLKEDGSQFMRWDLLNDHRIPVASGMYLALVELPDLNIARTLKLILVQEQQVLDRF